jgi:hypothetical protein
MQSDQVAPHRVLPYDIVYCTSQDDAFPAIELLREEEETAALRGWQSAKNCKYPQMLILRFPCDVELWQLQILSHECKIASKVEVRVFALGGAEEDVSAKAPPTFKEVKYNKLGSVGFNTNEKSRYRSKERKTVHLKTVGYFLKLLFHKPHQNPLNVAQQVGVYSIACFGQLVGYPLPRHTDLALMTPVPGQGPGGESPMSEGGLPPIHQNTLQHLAHRSPGRQHHHPPLAMQQQYPPPPPMPPENTGPAGRRLPPIKESTGSAIPSYAAGAAHKPQSHIPQPYDLPHPRAPDQPGTFRSARILEFESFYVRRTHELAATKAQAIDVENFVLAKEAKDLLIYLQGLSDHIYSLEAQKVRAIYAEDFDEAKRVKRQMDEAVDQAFETCGSGSGALASGDGAGYPKKRGQSEDRSVVDMPPIDPTRALQGSKHAFEDVPVTSKYAAMMAARAHEHSEGEDHDEHNSNAHGNDDADERGDSDGDESAAEAPVSRRAAPALAAEGPSVESHLTADGAFNMSQMPKWEQDVYTAIHTCTDELPAEAQLTSSAMEASELQGVLGRYAACCLLSKRWKLREAAIRAITDHMNTLFPNATPAAVVTSMCRFFDFRNSGLQDSISNVVVASCAFLQMVLKGGVVDCSISHLLPILANLLPRLIFRATEAMTKIREPVIATVLAFGECHEFGVDRVLAFVLSDPVDQDKRRISSQNSRIQIARLQITQQLLECHGSYAFPGNSFDNFMNKLMLPCLNHQNNEVRDLSVKIMSSVDSQALDLGRYMGQVKNPAVVATLQRSSGSNPETEERSKKRNTSATKRSGKRSVEPH